MRLSISAAVVCALFALQVTCAHGFALSPEVIEASGSLLSPEVDRRSLATTGCGDGYLSGSGSLNSAEMNILDCSWPSTCDKWTYELTMSITAGDMKIVAASGDTCAPLADGSYDTSLWTEIRPPSTGNVEVSGTLSSTSSRNCFAVVCWISASCVYTFSKFQLTCTTETTTLDAGVIAGIVIGCIVAVALSIVACAWCCKCCCFKRKVQPAQPGVVMMQPAYVMPK